MDNLKIDLPNITFNRLDIDACREAVADISCKLDKPFPFKEMRTIDDAINTLEHLQKYMENIAKQVEKAKNQNEIE